MNLRERLRQLRGDSIINIVELKTGELLFSGDLGDVRRWANKTWTYTLVDEEDYSTEGSIYLYVKKLGE